MVTVLRKIRLLHIAIIFDERWTPLISLPTKIAIKPIEATHERPISLRRTQMKFVYGNIMVLPQPVSVPASLTHNFSQERALHRNMGISTRIASRSFSDARHSILMMITTGKETGPGR